MTKDKTKEIKRKNKTVVAKYHALALENAGNQKCLITFTGLDETYNSTVKIRTVFFEKIRSIQKRKKNKVVFICKYTWTIEFGEDPYKNFNPHLHIQCFHNDIDLVKEAFNHTIKKLELNISRCHLLEAQDNSKIFFYVIKNYLPNGFDEEMEAMKKEIYKGKAMQSYSRKEYPDYLIKKLFNAISKLDEYTKTKPKYPFMQQLIQEKKLIIKKLAGNSEDDGYVKVKRWGYKLFLNTKKNRPKVFHKR